ncbi:Protein ALP1-like, partial [Pseudolycoriella hygida]
MSKVQTHRWADLVDLRPEGSDGDNMRFVNVNARYPGSNHDAFVWKCSLAYSFLEGIANEMGEEWEYFLLGDSGYPLQPWLMTPYDSPRTAAEKQFNRERKLRYSPLVNGHIIYSCTVLHNFLLENGYPVDDLEPIFDEPVDCEHGYPYFSDHRQQGVEMREKMKQYFTNK